MLPTSYQYHIYLKTRFFALNLVFYYTEALTLTNLQNARTCLATQNTKKSRDGIRNSQIITIFSSQRDVLSRHVNKGVNFLGRCCKLHKTERVVLGNTIDPFNRVNGQPRETYRCISALRIMLPRSRELVRFFANSHQRTPFRTWT